MILKRFLALSVLAPCLGTPCLAQPAPDSAGDGGNEDQPEEATASPPTQQAGEAIPSPSQSEQPSTAGDTNAQGYREVTGSSPPQPVETEPNYGIEEPPLPAHYRVPLPPPPRHVAPQTSLWLGGKLGWAFPMGDMWWDGRWRDGVSFQLDHRPFESFASSGPKTEIDVGARLARRYNVFLHWEYANLGPGEALPNDLGGQNRGHMNFLGGGFRFSSDPDELGVLIEAVIGYRGFRTSWESGTELTAFDSFLNTRLAFGADIRLSPLVSLSPMIGLAGGFFEKAEWTYADGRTESALSDYDEFAQHTVITLDLGAHFDVIRSKD